MEDNDEDQSVPLETTDNKNQKTENDEQKEDGEEEESDSFVYLKSSSIISILIIVIISLVCVLTTSLLIRTALHSRGITRRLSSYLGLIPNRTMDESILTFWQPKSIDDEQQPIETITTIINSSSSRPPPPSPPPSIVLSQRERKAQKIFRNFILPSLLLLSIGLGILAFYMRLHHHRYPAWGARPKRPKQYVTLELKQAQMNQPV